MTPRATDVREFAKVFQVRRQTDTALNRSFELLRPAWPRFGVDVPKGRLFDFYKQTQIDLQKYSIKSIGQSINQSTD